MLHVEPDSPVPIYEQIIAQLTFAIASEDVQVGSLIPSVRDLARRLVVNPNTVAKAFQELERQGIVISKRGRGMEVTSDAPEICQEKRRTLIRERLRHALREAVDSQLSLDDIEKMLQEELQRANGEKQ